MVKRASTAAVAVVMLAAACSGSPARRRVAPVRRRLSPSTFVNPFMGTGVGGRAVGDINASPAADTPLGMMQWGPDTAPDRAAGGGYRAGDTAISGLSLTHLSGPGCPAYGDIPILPTVGALPAAPSSTTAAFDPASQRATPGRYSVRLGSPPIAVDLAVTTRTGLARFTFPPSGVANVLFKVADSAAGASSAHAAVRGDREVDGAVTSGYFCDTPGTYTLYFSAQFDRPFGGHRIWPGRADTARGADAGPQSAVAVSFDTRKGSTVQMKVGISFVSISNARENLAAENRGWSLDAIAAAAARRWDATLGRIAVSGGSAGDMRTFYSALYHSLLHPNVFSDANGEYPGFDGKVHAASGYTQYANFSGWDTYRSQTQLVSLVAPRETGDMMHSLLSDYEQSGFLPKWAFAAYDSGEINGDSADAIIADAYAFGVRNFDTTEALRAMVKGATAVGTGLGWDVARQDLDQYLTKGWVQVDRRDKTSFDYTIGGSETLEYAIDDAAIAKFAAAAGDLRVASTFTRRAGNWRNLFDRATGYLEARRADGSFPPGPAFQVSPLPNIGQDGWEEGNAIQYTWSVPQDLRGLFDLMGGDAKVVSELDRFFTKLNSSRKEPYDWAGDEPALGIPWEYDFAGAPSRTQDVVRRIATQLYAATPDGEPGNDDLGAMSSWYVWAALGLYPETPGSADLVLATPLFPHASISLASGKTITIDATGASARTRFIRSLPVEGVRAPATCGARVYVCPWLPASVVSTGAVLHFVLGTEPDRAWGTSPGAAPPSMSR